MSSLSINGGSDVAGRHLARWANEDLKAQAEKWNGNDAFRTSGFKDKYIDHQGAWAQVHIAAFAGLTMVGNGKIYGAFGGTGYERMNAQYKEDRDQLDAGLRAKQQGQSTVTWNGQQHEVNGWIAEKHSELWDDGAGMRIGRLLESAYTGGKNGRKFARSEIVKMLCDY